MLKVCSLICNFLMLPGYPGFRLESVLRAFLLPGQPLLKPGEPGFGPAVIVARLDLFAFRVIRKEESPRSMPTSPPE